MLSLLSALALAAIAHGVPLPERTCSSAIMWSPCLGATEFQCGSFSVPLDYANPEVGNATLAVVLLKATTQPRLGTIFTNPGGPGVSGVGDLISRTGKVINNVTLGQYDIISWDPRGINQSTPLISCGFTSPASVAQFFGDTIPGVGFEARGNFTNQDDLDAFFSRVNETDAKLVEMGQKCSDSDGAFLKFMGTTSTVRDMVSLADSIEGPSSSINYWGFSYGTVLGNYFVNMFPERVGRIVLDGVVDSILWATAPTFETFGSALASAEAAFSGFTEQCAEAGPQNCAIAKNDSTPASVQQDIKQLIDTAYDLNKAGAINFTSFSIRAFMHLQLHDPTNWDAELVPQLAAFAAMAMNATMGNSFNGVDLPRRSDSSSLWPRQSTNDSAVDPAVQQMFTELVVSCVDSIDQENVTTERVFEEVVRVTQNITPTFGEFIVVFGQFFCHRFPVRAVERFTGPFNNTLANPIMVIGNRADPITPLANAQKIAATLGESARLLEQDGLGHTSLAENSDCTQGVVRDYFLNGTLPIAGQICETDQALFPPNITLVFQGVAAGGD